MLPLKYHYQYHNMFQARILSTGVTSYRKWQLELRTVAEKLFSFLTFVAPENLRALAGLQPESSLLDSDISKRKEISRSGTTKIDQEKDINTLVRQFMGSILSCFEESN